MYEELHQQIARIKEEAQREMEECENPHAARMCKAKFLGRKGSVTVLFREMGRLDPDERPVFGKEINELKAVLEDQFDKLAEGMKEREVEREIASARLDITLPGSFALPGHRHPLRQVMNEVIGIFTGMGFSVFEGPEIETDYHNFEALNVPKDHPARDMHDTFYLPDGWLLRTHTSPVQIHVMEKQKPPVFMIAPGAAYRRDNDVSHSPMFHQVEGLMVDKHITFSHLKGVLTTFCHEMFGQKRPVRFRPSFFPFTEPSAEVDIQCVICGGSGCRVCKHSGWVEVLGSGMVDPEVFKAVRYDPKKYTGFAFGMGIERIAMLKFGINDIRLFYENDMRFLDQF
jgi:phenylalanyl-tRNA synthetase alpha chain